MVRERKAAICCVLVAGIEQLFLEKWIEDCLSLNEREKALFFLHFDRGCMTTGYELTKLCD